VRGNGMAKEKNKRNFFKNFKAELKKVIWPTPKQLVTGTVAVITIVLIIAAIVFVLDLAFDFLNTAGLNRIKERVTNVEYNVVPDEAEGAEIIPDPWEEYVPLESEELEYELYEPYEGYENYNSYENAETY